MRIDWMKNANEHNGTDQQKATIQKAAADLEWLAMPKVYNLFHRSQVDVA